MWKLIVLPLFICNILFFNHSEFVILILDDCQDWSSVPNNALRTKSDFIYSKDLPKNKSVSIGHSWNEPKLKPETKSVSYSDLNNKEIFYSSEMSFENWDILKDRKVFVLKPEDFCSSKRFEFGYQFVLYEVKIIVSYEE